MYRSPFLVKLQASTRNFIGNVKLDRSKTRIFWISLERLISQQFLLGVRVIFDDSSLKLCIDI